MTAATLLARERPVRARELIDNPLRRFAWRHREDVTRLTLRHRRLADLALSFPALLFALAVPRPRFDPEPVIERVIAGAPLSELAAAAGIPMWTRRLGPEAFLYPIPDLPDGEMFRRQIANHLPQKAKRANRWLRLVANTARWGDEAIALWFARHADNPEHAEAISHWRLVCLWAWHGDRPEALASKHLVTKWSPDLAPERAARAAHDWADSIETVALLGDRQIEPWAEAATVDGYTFEPIRDAAQLVAAARVMRNCLRSYAGHMAKNNSNMWLVHRGGEPEGVAELFVSAGQRLPKLGEIRGPFNLPPADNLVLAVHRWHRTHVELRPAEPNQLAGREWWRRLWRDYWLAKQGFPPWLPLRTPRLYLNLRADPEWAPQLPKPRRRRPMRRR